MSRRLRFFGGAAATGARAWTVREVSPAPEQGRAHHTLPPNMHEIRLSLSKGRRVSEPEAAIRLGPIGHAGLSGSRSEACSGGVTAGILRIIPWRYSVWATPRWTGRTPAPGRPCVIADGVRSLAACIGIAGAARQPVPVRTRSGGRTLPVRPESMYVAVPIVLGKLCAVVAGICYLLGSFFACVNLSSSVRETYLQEPFRGGVRRYAAESALATQAPRDRSGGWSPRARIARRARSTPCDRLGRCCPGLRDVPFYRRPRGGRHPSDLRELADLAAARSP